MARVLIAEDDPDIRALVARRVAQLGHDVVEALDGQAALDIALADDVDLAVLDWMMPVRTGLEVCRAIRADARVGRMKIVMLTAKAHDDDLARPSRPAPMTTSSSPSAPPTCSSGSACFWTPASVEG